jgi:hypothetical protein
VGLWVPQVHERDRNTDFLLIILRDLLPQRPDLRVILMSATLQTLKLANYFAGCPIATIGSTRFPVQVRDGRRLSGWGFLSRGLTGLLIAGVLPRGCAATDQLCQADAGEQVGPNTPRALSGQARVHLRDLPAARLPVRGMDPRSRVAAFLP